MNPLPDLLAGIRISAKDRAILCERIAEEIKNQRYAVRCAAAANRKATERNHALQIERLTNALELQQRRHLRDIENWAAELKEDELPF